MVKSPLYGLAQLNSKGNVFDTIDVDEHRRKRKIISQPIAERSMRGFEPVMSEQVDIFVEQLAASSGNSEPVNMTQRCMWLGGDVAGYLGFGYPFQMQTADNENRWLQGGLALASARINIYMQAPFVHVLEPLIQVIIKKAINTVNGIAAKMIQARLAQDRNAKRDLYSFAVDHMGGADLEDSELWAEAFFFILAGGNTTATAMSGSKQIWELFLPFRASLSSRLLERGVPHVLQPELPKSSNTSLIYRKGQLLTPDVAVFFYLSRYPDCYKKLADEIRTTFAASDEIRTGEQLRRCDYLRACIHEALRLSTPNTATMWRRQSPNDRTKEPLVIDGHEIPPGTDIGVNMYSIHHNAAYFPDPFIFRPERWLDSSPKQLAMMQKAWAPFTLGAHSCPGKAVAYLEISLTLARTLWRFDFEPAPGESGRIGAGMPGRTDGREKECEYQLYDTFSAMHDGPVLMFRPRGD